MRLPVGIEIRADGAQAIGSLNRIASTLENLARNPASMATGALSRFQRVGTEATQGVLSGFREAESAWYRLGGALGVPFTMAGVVGAISGVRSLKDVLIGANAELETNRVRMSAMMKDFNDTKFSAGMKGDSLIKMLRQYAADTPFEISQLVEAATTATSVTKSPEAAFQLTKYAAKLAALRGTTDVGWASQALVGALNGNTTSLKESFGINVSEDVLQNMAMMMGFGPNSPQGRLMALQRLIDQKAGKGEGIINDLAKTGVGSMATLKDSLTMPLTDAFTPAYDRMVASLVRFNEAYGKFTKTDGFKGLQAALTDKFLIVGQGVERVMDLISTNLERIPDLIGRYGPTISTVGKFAAGVAAVNVAALALKGSLGLALTTFMGVARFLTPISMLVTNPALVAGLLALSAVMWPTARSLEVGGKSLDAWLEGVERWAQEKDWQGVFTKPLLALKKLISGEYFAQGGITAAIEDAFGPDTLLPRLAKNVVMPILTGMKDAVLETFPELSPTIERFSGVWAELRDDLEPYLPLLGKLALGLGALTVAGRALGVASPLLAAAGMALRGVGAGIGAIQFVIANPLLAGGLFILASVLMALTKDADLSAEGIGKMADKAKELAGSVDWAGIAQGVSEFAGTVAELMTAFGEGFLSTAGPTLKAMWEAGTAFAGVAWPVIKAAFDSIGNALGLDGAKAWAEAIGKVAGVMLPLIGAWKLAGLGVGVLGRVAAPVGRVAGAVGRGAGFLNMARLEILTNPAGRLAGLRTVLTGLGGSAGRFFTTLTRIGGWLGSARLEILTNPAGKLAGLRTVFTTMMGPVSRFVGMLGRAGAWAGRMGGAIARALAPVGRAFAAILPRVITIGRAILPWAGRLLGLSNPIGWIITGVTALVALGVTLYKRWEPFRNLVDGVWAGIKRMPAAVGVLATVIGQRLKGAWEGVVGWVGRMKQGITDTLTGARELIDKVGGFIRNMPEAIGGFLASIPERFASILDNAPAPLRAAFDWIAERAGLNTPEEVTDEGIGGGSDVNVGLDRTNSGPTLVIERLEAPVTIYSQDGTVLDSAVLRDMLRDMMRAELPSLLESGLLGVRRA